MNRRDVTLIGDGIENPANASAMRHAAAMFACGCLFRDTNGLLEAWRGARGADPEERQDPEQGQDLGLISLQDLRARFKPVVAFDNLPGARDVYGFSLPGAAAAVVVGNERKGIGRDVRRLADCAVQVPMVSRTLSCINVAAASAVALYYLTREASGRLQVRSHPDRHRPELLLVGSGDHFELGSAIRSAGAFGWRRVLLEDRGRVWFGCDRGVRSEGRGAARRGRNPIRIVPTEPARRFGFDEALVVTARPRGVPLHRALLAGGPRQIIAVPDESGVDVDREDWSRLGREVQLVSLALPREDFPYRYRLTASIVLAEAARQVGRPPRPGPRRPPPMAPSYDSALEVIAVQAGETVYLEDLAGY
ncbi:MAG: hypothetical protein HY721_08865 [Planctomycetes bacterium]|nr:hypothetical protein [Planctomycetota bacterium]